jgi:RNA polymerase sigma-70 factor (ECF subfamily)
MVRSFTSKYARQSPAPTADPAGDDDLLTRKTEEAFGTIVERHGARVRGICRRVLGDPHDAEDAFQTTFLILVRRGGGIRDPRALGGWLSRVAFRVALTSRARVLKQRRRDRALSQQTPRETSIGAGLNDLRPLLAGALQQLPEKYRAPLVLCYLEGRTNEQAAAELRWPLGSMSRRLARGQQLLRRALVAADRS